jgi:hypothetical protein
MSSLFFVVDFIFVFISSIFVLNVSDSSDKLQLAFIDCINFLNVHLLGIKIFTKKNQSINQKYKTNLKDLKNLLLIFVKNCRFFHIELIA